MPDVCLVCGFVRPERLLTDPTEIQDYYKDAWTHAEHRAKEWVDEAMSAACGDGAEHGLCECGYYKHVGRICAKCVAAARGDGEQG